MRNIIHTILCLCAFNLIYAQDNNQNYIKTTTYELGTSNDESEGIINYPDTNIIIPASSMFTCGGGTGNAVFNITNNLLTFTVNASGGTSSCNLKAGPITGGTIALPNNPTLPDMYLGPIYNQDSAGTDYYAIIQAGQLRFCSKYNLTSVSAALSASFTGTAVNYTYPTNFNVYSCDNGILLGAGNNTLVISGNTIQLSLSSGWASSCGLNTSTDGVITLGVTVPDTELGTIQEYGYDTAYKAKIEGNKLKFYIDGKAPKNPFSSYYTSFTSCLNLNANPLLETESVVYYDQLSKPTVAFTYDKQNKRIWAKEITYDEFGRQKNESFPVPLPACDNYAYTRLLDGSNTLLSTYYSNANIDEPYQATAQQPYSTTNYDTLNPGNIVNVVGGNQIEGVWKTGFSYTVPAAQEMYYLYGKDYFNGPMVGDNEKVITKFFKSVSVDANGTENVVFSDGEGNILASARTGSATTQPVISLIGTQGFVDVHIPKGIGSANISLIGGIANYIIYNLKTGVATTTLTGGNCYRIEAITKPTEETDVYITPSGTLTYDNPNGTVRGISYRVNYYDYALNIYNRIGQLTKSIQPNGTTPGTVIVNAPTHMGSANTSFVSTYTYNNEGQLTETTSPDEGTSFFLYRADGQIRYSQSSIQRIPPNLGPKQLSYTEYDSFGRPVESGVITNSRLSWALINPNDILVAGTRSEQTFTVYDNLTNIPSGQLAPPVYATILTDAGLTPSDYKQKNLSGNVAITYAATAGTVTAATWYSYDIYGRIEWLVQWNADLGAKTLHYEYDNKGNVKNIYYHRDKATDYFAHFYEYNDANQLISVNTAASKTKTDAHVRYTYYLTGELKRIAYSGAIQGTDYVYTLGGMLKSINHPSLAQADDPGGDSNDLFGITLDYYVGDYQRSGKSIVTSKPTGGGLINPDLFDGKIKAVRFANKSIDLSGSTIQQKAYTYSYNSRDWLSSATFGTVTSPATINPTSNFKEYGLTYDANGNITSLSRTNESGTIYDNLGYTYDDGKNRLLTVNDTKADTLVNYDIDGLNNYTYNSIGQLTKNGKENLDYVYNALGLVTQISSNGNPIVKFYYNERGQRIKKESFQTTDTYTLLSTTYYVVDLSGNIIAVYNKTGSAAITLTEHPVYGIDRLGVYSRLGRYTNYELKDHLGNVRAVFTKDYTGALLPAGYADYYPFGEKLPTRNSTAGYRFGFQGQEFDAETNMEAFRLRLWDGRIGRWLSPDPNGQYFSPYLGMGNNPISRIDPDGGLDYPPESGDYENGYVWNDSTGSWTQENGVWNDNIGMNNFMMEIVIERDTSNSVAATIGEFALGAVPLSGTIDMYKGVRDGNWGQFAMGAAFVVFDVATLGGGSIAKGGLKLVLKEIAEEGIKKEAKFLISTARKKAVDLAWKEEIALVKATGEGTRNWSVKQIKQLKNGEKISGFVGHHINSVKGYPLLAGLPSNIEFVTTSEHFIKHLQNWRNVTSGELITRGF